MRRISFLLVIAIGLIGLSGCYTIPRHYTTQEIIVYYPPPPTPPPQDYYYPPIPPSPPVYFPTPPEPPNQPRDRQPEKQRDSYGQRDPLKGGSDRDRGGIKTDPPVRNHVDKDRGDQ